MAGIVPVILNKGRYAPDCVGADAPAKENELKNYLMFALLICATASMAFGQFGVVVDPAKVDVACPDDECHVAPVFMGEGGFVGELADGFDMANFVVTCGNTTASGSAAGDGGGVVRQLFSMANGLACHSDDGSIQIHGLADGGWYWINDDMNSAVSPLIAKDALMGDEVMPTDPGGVTLMASDYGTYVKSGSRVGILPHFVPTAPVEIPPVVEPEAATVCAPYWHANSQSYRPGRTDCMLGNGGTEIAMWLPTENRGRGATISGSVTRPAKGAAALNIELQLWGNGSGHIASGTHSAALRGWRGIPARSGQKAAPFDTDFGVFNNTAGPRTSASLAGVTIKSGGERPRNQMVPVDPETEEDPSTPMLDRGHSDDTGAARCTQNSREGSGIGAPMEIAFLGALGSTVWVSSEYGSPAIKDAISDSDASVWAEAYNDNAGPDQPAIKVFDDGNGNENVPLVVCKMKEVPGTASVNAVLEITHSDTYCGSGKNVAADVVIYTLGAPGLNSDIEPPIAQPVKLGNTWHAAATTLQVLCQ